jgi:hypothetical protein
VERGEIDEDHSVVVGIGQSGPDSDGKSRLADATWAEQRQEAHV